MDQMVYKLTKAAIWCCLTNDYVKGYCCMGLLVLDFIGNSAIILLDVTGWRIVASMHIARPGMKI